MNQQEAVLNCVICNHPFDWNNLEYCPNCNWQQIDYIGDIEHTAVLLGPEREAWIAKKNYKVSDFSYEGYIPALVEAMKNQFNFEDFNEDYKISPFFREWHEDDESFNERLAEKPVLLGKGSFFAKLYNPKTGVFPLEIKWDQRISEMIPPENKNYSIVVPKTEAKAVFDSVKLPPIYLHLNFDELKQIHAINAYLVANNQVFEISPLQSIQTLEIQPDEEEIIKHEFDDELKKETIQNKELDEQGLQELLNWVNRYRKVWNYNDTTKAPALANIQELTSLTVLIVSYNQLTTLPESIGELKNLRNLYVNNNPLTASTIQFLKQLQQKNPNLEIYGI